MYEQGVSAALDGTPLGKGVSAGIHESQSRLWENVVGRSRGFWEHFYPSLQRVFPEQLGSVPITVFHRAINKVARSTIRTDADEVTYNLHIMLRFDLELQLLEGRARRERPCLRLGARRCKPILASRQPTIATAVYRTFTGTPATSAADSRATRSAIFYPRSFMRPRCRRHPDIPREIARGEFDTLHTWLRDNVYQHGSKFAPNHLIERADRCGDEYDAVL